MNSKLLSALNFCRLIDETGQLSLSNLAVIVVVSKLALSTSCDLGSSAALLTVLSGYHFKRYLSTKQKTATKISDTELTELKAKVNRMEIAVGMTRVGFKDAGSR